MFKEQKLEERVNNTRNVTGLNVGLAVSLILSFPLIACLEVFFYCTSARIAL